MVQFHLFEELIFWQPFFGSFLEPKQKMFSTWINYSPVLRIELWTWSIIKCSVAILTFRFWIPYFILAQLSCHQLRKPTCGNHQQVFVKAQSSMRTGGTSLEDSAETWCHVWRPKKNVWVSLYIHYVFPEGVLQQSCSLVREMILSWELNSPKVDSYVWNVALCFCLAEVSPFGGRNSP